MFPDGQIQPLLQGAGHQPPVPQPSTLPLYQYQLRSLDFVINRLFMKLFRTSDIGLQVVAQCHEEFCFDLPSVQLARRRKKFLDKLYHCHSV